MYKQTFLICLINFLAFFTLEFLSEYIDNIHYYFSFWDYNTGSFSPYQLITYQFVHADFIHLYNNMLFFILASVFLEDKIKSPNLIYYFILFGVSGAITYMIFTESNLPMVGSSGAVWGIVVFYSLLSKINLLKLFIFSIFVFEIYLSIFETNTNVAHWCHVGGGLSAYILYIYEESK